MASHCHLGRNCHCVILSLAIRTEWVIFFKAGALLSLWWTVGLPKPHPFSSDKCRLVLFHSPGSHWFGKCVSQAEVHHWHRTMWQSQTGQDVYFHFWKSDSELMKLSVLLYFPTRLSCRWLIVCWWSNASCWLATAALWFVTLWLSLCFCAQERRTVFREQTQTASGIANIRLIVRSVGSKDQVFQRMLREMMTSCSVFSLLKVYWESWRVQWYLVQY